MDDDPTAVPERDKDAMIDLAAERAVLGAILLDPASVYEINGVLTMESFADPRHGIIWEALHSVVGRGLVPDPQTVSSVLQERQRLNAVGGAQYLGELTDCVSGAAWIRQHAEIVADLAQKRSARLKFAVLAYRAKDPTWSFADIVALASASVLDLCTPRRDSTLSTSLEVMEAVLADLSRPVDEAPGLPTPLASMTRLTGGFQSGQLIVVAARPSVGKTAFLLQCVIAAADAGAWVLLCSLETQRIPIGRRMIASRASISLDAVSRRRAQTTVESDAIMHAASDIARLPVIVDNASIQGLESIRATAYRMKTKGQLHMIAIDYLQLMSISSKSGGNRERDVAELSRGLKVIAGNLNVPIIVCAQLNRDSEKERREPRLTDLRESGALEQDADVVVFLHREGDSNEQDETEPVDLIIAKQRDGARGKIPMVYRKNTTCFYDVEQRPNVRKSTSRTLVPSDYDPAEFGEPPDTDN